MTGGNMIFAAEHANDNHTLLTESGANWLLVETDEPGKLKLKDDDHETQYTLGSRTPTCRFF